MSDSRYAVIASSAVRREAISVFPQGDCFAPQTPLTLAETVLRNVSE